MKRVLTILFSFISLLCFGQAHYNPAQQPGFTFVVNKPFGESFPVPLDARSVKADTVNGLYRPYNGTSEVLTYLNTIQSRTGWFPIIVNVGGSLQSNGTFIGGQIFPYWFLRGTADTQLIQIPSNVVTLTPEVDTLYRKNDSTIGFTINRGPERSFIIRGSGGGSNLNSLSLSAPSSVFNTPVSFSNSSGDWSGTLSFINQNANSVIAGPATGSPGLPSFRSLVIGDLPTNIPNANLANSSIIFNIGTTGTSPNWGSSSAALGSTQNLNIPILSSVNTGIGTPSMFNFWNAKVDSTLQSNDSVYEFRNGIRFFRYIIVGGGGGISSLNGLTSAIQVFATPGTTGTAPNWSSSGSTHTLNIPAAATGGVSLGGISNTDYTTFNSKQPFITPSNTIKQYWNGFEQFVNLNSDSVAEGSTNLFFTNARARLALSVTNNAPAGGLTYNNSTGVFNLNPKVDTLYRTIGKDSIQFTINGRYYSILDSIPSTPGWQTVLNAGSTLTQSNTVINTGQSFTWLNAGTGLFKWSGLSQDTTNTVGPYVSYVDSSLRMIPWQKFATKLSQYLPVFQLFPRQGLSPLGTSNDSLQLGGVVGTFFQPDTIFTAGQPFFITGLPNKSSLLTTDSALIETLSGQLYKVPGSALGGGGSNGVGRDSVITITSGTSSTVTNGYNIVRINPSSTMSTYSLTIPTTWHTSNDLLISFGGTITSGPVVTSLTINVGAGQTFLQAVVPTTANAGEIIRYHLISGTIDQRIN